MKYGFIFIGLALFACSPADPQKTADTPPVEHTAPAGEYRLDDTHASLIFRVDHLGYSFYTGSFSAFDAVLQFDPAAPDAMSVTAEIDVASLIIPTPPQGFFDTLMSAKWFDAGAFPIITYQSTGVTLTGANTARVDGEMTFLGRTAPVSMDVTFNGGYEGFHPHDPQGRVGFSAHGSLMRSAFGMTEGLPPEGSNLGVGDEVTFRFDGELLGPPTPEKRAPVQAAPNDTTPEEPAH